MSGHRWSGWPGAWCLDCGIDDAMEVAIATNAYDPYTETWEDSDSARNLKAMAERFADCREPGSHRHDPYDPPALEPIV